MEQQVWSVQLARQSTLRPRVAAPEKASAYMTNSTTVFRILCLDGGGIRGAFTASVLASIEAKVLDGRSLTDYCDLIAGTSTGALIALALAFEQSPQKICDFYSQQGEGARIFGKGCLPHRWGRKVLQLFMAPYSGRTLEKEIEALIGKVRFGAATKRLVLPSYNADRGNVHIFKYLFPADRKVLSARGYPQADYDRFDDLWAAEAGAASAAAPTFFPAKFVASLKSHYIDGGLWANCPVLPAIAEAIGPLGIGLDRVRVLSVGTRFENMALGGWKQVGGFLPWNWQVIGLLMNAQAAGAIGTARWILRDRQFLRLDDRRDENKDRADPPLSLDDIRSIGQMITRGAALVERESAAIKNFLHDWREEPTHNAV